MKKTREPTVTGLAPLRVTYLRAEPTITLAVSPVSSVCGRAITFTATVSPVAPVTGVPTGTVSFRANGDSAVLAPLRDGVASFTTPLPAGSHTITACYTGDDNFRATPDATLDTRIWRHGFPDLRDSADS